MWFLVLVTLFVSNALIIPSEAFSQKRGVGFHNSKFRCGDTWKYTGASWWYDWDFQEGERKWNNCPALKPGYIPMIHDESHVYKAVIPPEAKYVLGFNEPNELTQANMTPERCGELWPVVEEKAAGRYLVGPALAGCGLNITMCLTWYSTFFNNCKGCRVDALALHDYYHCGVHPPSQLLSVIETISITFNRKIWLSEFSCRGNVSLSDHLKYMQTILPLLEESPYVEKYAWYASRISSTTPFLETLNTQLLRDNSSDFTVIGEYYNNFHL